MKLRILLANYRYFLSGGPERYMFNVQDALSARGHKVIPYAATYYRNRQTPYARFFSTPIGSPDEIYFDQHRKTFRTIFRSLTRLFYSSEIEKDTITIASNVRPHVAYVLHYLRKLSPSLLVGLKKKGIPIAVRLSDYAMLCPQAHCLRGTEPCTLCLDGDLRHSIIYRCVKESLPISLINALATTYHQFKHYFDLIDAFVCTNPFMAQMMTRAGYPSKKLHCIPTFTKTEFFCPAPFSKRLNVIAYAGRLNYIKGVHVLIEAFAKLKNTCHAGVVLKIAGSGQKAYVAKLQEQVHSLGLDAQVLFLGHIDRFKLRALFQEALITVVPSLWYENLPNTVIESLASGTPVIAPNLGSIPYCVKSGKSGMLFRSGDAEDLADKLQYGLNNELLLQQMANLARKEAERKFSPDRHINSLVTLFKQLSS